jgi:thiol-disulfide isomerase/thioredoxin
MHKFILVYLFLNIFILVESNGQNNQVVLKYNIPTKQLAELSIQKLGLREVFSNDPDFIYSIKEKRVGTVKLDLLTKGLYKIADGIYGHTIYLEEGDTISISLNEIPNLNKVLSKKSFIGYFNNLNAIGKYSWHYIFFDEYNKRTEKLFPLKNYEIANDLMTFKTKCDKALLIGENLLDSLYEAKKISINFKLVAEQELKAMYVSRMCTPLSLIPKKRINTDYFEILNTLKFNDSSFAVMCKDYLQAGALYTYYIHNSINVNELYFNLKNEMGSILENYTGIIRDKLLARQIQDYIGKNYPLFDSCYQVFLNECKDLSLKNTTINKVNSFELKNKISNSFKFEEILIGTDVRNVNNIKSSILTQFQDSIPTLIDCWATWCIPCRDQMQFMHTFEKKYKNKLHVVYLSFDRDEVKWKSYQKKNNLGVNQFIIDNDFGSAFSKYFNIHEIPRYILISKRANKVLNANMPLPALEVEFEEELKKYLK